MSVSIPTGSCPDLARVWSVNLIQPERLLFPSLTNVGRSDSLPKLEGPSGGLVIHSAKRRLVTSGMVAGITATIFVGFSLELIVSSLLVRRALQRQRRRSNGDGCDARVARKNAFSDRRQHPIHGICPGLAGV